MKILVYVEKFMSPTLTFVYNEIIELAKHHEVKVVCTSRCNKKEFPFEDIIVMPLTWNKFEEKFYWYVEKLDIALIRKNNKFKKDLAELIREFSPDIIHCHFGYEAIAFLENMEKSSVPTFISFHGYDASQMLSKKCYVAKVNSFLKNKNVIPIYVSNFIKGNLEKANVNMRNGSLLHYGVRHDFFNPEMRSISEKKPFIFLQISTFNEKKGHIYTLKAFKKFLEKVGSKEEYKLILAGDFGSIKQIKQAVVELSLSDYVEFAGFANRNQCKELLLKSNVFLHHSVTAINGDTEGLPNAILEAMAMELPVIATWHAGIPELIEDGINGYLVEERDVETYAQRMRDILSWGYQKKNREKVLTQFSITSHYDALINIYNRTIHKELDVLHLFSKYPNNVTSNWLYNLIVNTPGCKAIIAAEYYTKHNFYDTNFEYIDNPIASITHYKESIIGWNNKLVDKIICLIIEKIFTGFKKIINEKLENTSVDIVHAHFADIACKFVDFVKKKNLPLVVSFYGYDYEYLPFIKPIYIDLYNDLFFKADRFICEGTHGAGILQKLGCPKEKIEVIRLGVNTDIIPFRVKNKVGNQLTLVQVSALREKKGHIYALKAFHEALIDCPNMHLTFVGSGDFLIHNELMQYIHKHGIVNKISILKEIDFARLHSFLSKFDVFIHPSCYSVNMDCEGGAPIVLLDAQASGLPIISTTHCDIPDEVIDHKTGLLTPEKNVEALSESIKKFYRMESEEYSKYCEAARTHVEEKFSIKKNAIHLKNVYNTLVHEYTNH